MAMGTVVVMVVYPESMAVRDRAVHGLSMPDRGGVASDAEMLAALTSTLESLQ
jgi:hypothetical protein